MDVTRPRPDRKPRCGCARCAPTSPPAAELPCAECGERYPHALLLHAERRLGVLICPFCEAAGRWRECPGCGMRQAERQVRPLRGGIAEVCVHCLLQTGRCVECGSALQADYRQYWRQAREGYPRCTRCDFPHRATARRSDGGEEVTA